MCLKVNQDFLKTGKGFPAIFKLFWASETWEKKEKPSPPPPCLSISPHHHTPDCSAKSRFALWAPYLSIWARTSSSCSLKFAIPYYYWSYGGLTQDNLIYPVVAGKDGTSCPDAPFPVYSHYDDCMKGPGLVLSQQGELHNYRQSQPALAQLFRNWVVWPKDLVRGRAAALEG